MMDEFANDADDMNINFEDFKSALKAESKIDKIETFMNAEDVQIDKNKKIKTFLGQPDNLEIFISLISRPHEVESRIWWNDTYRIDMKDKLLFENYREFNLRNSNNYYLYDIHKVHKLDYVNKNAEIKNIYRAYNALQICLTNKNIHLILDIPGAFDRVMTTIIDGLHPKNNASIEHCTTFIKAVLVEKPMETVKFLISRRVPVLLLNLLDNPCILPDLNMLLL
jgi:hypothetical protein